MVNLTFWDMVSRLFCGSPFIARYPLKHKSSNQGQINHLIESSYTEDDIFKILEFLVTNIFVVFTGKVFQHIVDILTWTNCSTLMADIFL